MEITIKKEVEEKITIPVPSYWKNEDKIVSIVSDEKCVSITSFLGYHVVSIGSPENRIDSTFVPCTQLEFMKAYNKAHEAIKELIISVKYPA